MKGIKRFRQAIKNQRDAGEGEFHLNYHDAKEIADEIDAELLEICNSAEREIGRYVWVHGVPAPVDADGEVVPLTTVEMYGDDGRRLKVSMFRFSINPEATRWVAMCSNDNGGNGYADVSNLHLRCPDSWEKLEEDIQKVTKASDICGYYDKVGKPCNGCPARNIPGMCSAIVLRDALRRAKALAGRGED